ncbi:hypothetical protein [Acinetobacter towneri]|uniref:hypothetical protein n=1 Tax=Acinetobacter towneri TaxID=202956 RepID=UPI002576F559|nr:hypothetical protein [Acinetobacter towneri]MDM1486831.1 hypothetical protein [Acinetobacter towneri]
MKKELVIWEKFSFYLCCFLSMLIPIPLFLDGLVGGVILQKESFPVVNSFPIPIGLLAFLIVFIIFFINSFLFKQEYSLLVKNRTNRLVLYFLSIFIFLWSFFLSGNNFFRVFQLILPFILILIVGFPVGKGKIKKITYFYLISFFCFNSTHLVSIFLNNNLFEVSEREYGLYWGYGIYQAFVSYPGVLALFFCLVSFLFFFEKRVILKFFLFIFILVIIVAIGLAARRISFLEMIFTFLFLFLFLFIDFVKNKGVVNKNLFLSCVSFIFLIFFILSFYFNMPIFRRASSGMDDGGVDSGRLIIYERAFNFLFSDVYFLMFGYNGYSGFHNYFLELIFAIGLFPFLITILTFVFMFKVRINLSFSDIGSYILLSLFGCFFLQSMFNASITQPLYLCNFLMIMLISFFYINSEVRSV